MARLCYPLRSSTTTEQPSRSRISELDAVCADYGRAAGLEGDPSGRRDPSRQRPAVAELHDTAGTWSNGTRIRTHLRHRRPSSEGQSHVPAIDGLGDVAAVRHVELDHSYTAVAPNPKSAKSYPAHDPAGCPDDDDNPDPHSDRDARAPPRPCREQHERVVVPGREAAWQPRG